MNSKVSFCALLALAMAITVFSSGCGQSTGSAPPNYASALRDAPAPLAKLYSQANELLPGGKDAFEDRLKALKGFPVVVNAWASWCGACIEEISMFQTLSARFGTRVAFVGIDTEDSADEAARFLARAPLPYPSYIDSDADIRDSFRGLGLPNTAFFSRSGDLVSVKFGRYRDGDELE